MAGKNPTISTVTLSVNRLNNQPKDRDCQAVLKPKPKPKLKPNYTLSTKDTIQIQIHKQVQIRRVGKDITQTADIRKVVAILITVLLIPRIY